MLDFIRRLFAPPPTVTHACLLRAGPVILLGRVREAGDLLRSPIRSTSCVAFFYRSIWRAPSRGNSVTRTFQSAQVYCPRFALELEQGEVAVMSRKGDTFTVAEHQAAVQAALNGFEAMEHLIRPGDRVRVEGRVRSEGDVWIVVPDRISVLDPQPPAGVQGPRTRDRKGR